MHQPRIYKEQMIEAIKCEKHLRGVGSFVPPPHFTEEYKDKNIERQFLCDVRNHETRGTCILHQNQTSTS
jgi:hypothetical protein